MLSAGGALYRFEKLHCCPTLVMFLCFVAVGGGGVKAGQGLE